MITFVIILISKVVNKDLTIIHDYEKNIRTKNFISFNKLLR